MTKSTFPSLNVIDEILNASSIWRLRFPDAVEARFEADNGQERCRHLIACGLVALTLYDAFLVSD
jgi:hypothetical protein